MTPFELALADRLSLRHLLPEARFLAADDLFVSGCTADSRQVRPGDVFVALPGVHCDGHQYIGEALDRGAAGLVIQQPLDIPGVPCCLVPDTRQAFGRICHAMAGHPSRTLKVIGVTGTNGKTTTSWLIASILSAAGYETGVLGTLGCYDGRDWSPATHTTPPADQLARLLAHMLINGCSHAVMEVSSHALDQARVGGTVFDAACVTNVRRDHLDYHGTIAGYRQAKSKLFSYLAPEGFAIINADDPGAAGYLGQLDGPVLTVGIEAPAEISGAPVERFVSEQTFLLTAGSDVIPVRTAMIGRHHIQNCLVAAAVGLAYGIDLPTVVRGLEAVRSVPGRLQRLECGQPFGVFVDYAHTPDALACVLAALRDVVRGRLICVFGAGGDRDRQKRPLMGRAVETGADLAILTNDNPRSEDPAQIRGEVLAGFVHPQAVRAIDDRARAIEIALATAAPGDCVLIAGKGHETQQIMGGENYPFDDAEVARAWLYREQPSLC